MSNVVHSSSVRAKIACDFDDSVTMSESHSSQAMPSEEGKVRGILSSTIVAITSGS
jgi:hypothetical protein